MRTARVVSRRIHGFSEVVGRDAELNALHTAIGASTGSGTMAVRVLTGLGGMGKSSVARAYATRHQNDYGLVWWIAAEDSGAVPGEFRLLLAALGLPEVEGISDPIQVAHVVLANRQDRWLLIYDNVTDQASLRGLIPATGEGAILVTSRAGVWSDPGIVLPLGPLPAEPAVDLLTGVGGDFDRTTAADLAAELGGLPLALQQAAAYVAENGVTLAAYLRLYRSHRAVMYGEGQPPDYDQRVATTWLVAFERLPASARALLNLLSWCAPDAIPLDILLRREAEALDLPEVTRSVVASLLGELERNRAIAALRAYSLITVSGTDATMHRLVQAVTRDQLAAAEQDEAWADSMGEVLLASVPELPATAITLRAWQRLHAHMRQHLDLSQITDAPRTLVIRKHLASWTGEAGDPSQARDQYGVLYPDHARILGPDHSETLTMRSELAFWTGEAGDPAEARDRFADLLPDHERVLGPDHPDTLTNRGELAHWTGRAGDPSQARDRFADLLPDHKRILGPDHPATLDTRGNLAHWTGEAGDPLQARDLFAALLPDHERVLGPDHPDTLTIRENLAYWTAESS